MLIRPATPQDLPAVQALWNRMIEETLATFTSDPKTLQDLQDLLAARAGSFLVAEDAGVQGFVTWGPFRPGPGYARTAEHTIITATPGRGTGRALLEAAFDRAAGQGLLTLVAGISAENPAAIRFHARLGFAESGRLPQVGQKWGRRLDLVLMTRALAPR
ncbi:N-acetyltransferase family protein [Sulfitobacter sp. HNIBRBA3233]|uniref:GNAT family N-acetyltransferase n=1 Tax=Sulfitobacter marinivivus TaxID=3158558 RepID=UPI0032DEEFAB